ncbi:MAG: 16S rRNA (uracil(1498)-N(3))-methyltransferase, partial [Verrucomicrobiae bacterium]|nr:16S rRNA (uracil(1498)-N(3))-methyltransferase [Verrucomicrobiae bacterium]
MRRFFLSREFCCEPVLQLTGREAHHAAHVLRAQRGEHLTVLDGAGGEYLCAVREVGRQDVTLEVLEKRQVPPPPLSITLLQALPKGRAFEFILEKATELGVRRIVPLISARSISRPDEAGGRDKAEKWRLTLIEALKQCGAPWLPELGAPVSLETFLARGERFDLQWVASLQPDALHPREALRQHRSRSATPVQRAAVWV